jgi:hypothetical protein
VLADASVLLTSRLGLPVRSLDGVRIGRVVDITVLYDVAHPAAHRLGVGRGRRIQYLLPWDLVRMAEGVVTLSVGAAALSAYATPREPALESHELLLARDVLDSQVVDLAGRRLSRVSEVLLVAEPDGRLEVAAVDVGAGSLLRRMGLRRVGNRLAAAVVDWSDLHLTSRRGHVVQLETSTTGVHRLEASELADLFTRLSTDKAADIVRTVHPARSAAALHVSHPGVRHRLVHVLAPAEVQRLLEAAPPALARLLAEAHASATVPRRQLRTSGWRVRRPAGTPPPADVGDRR